MDKHNCNQPWDQGMFETGRTRPPKNHNGVIALLLVTVVFLAGLTTALGILNAQMFARLSRQREEKEESVSFVEETTPTQTPTEAVPEATDPTISENAISLDPTPQSVANVPQQEGLSLQEIYARNIDSVVSISCRMAGGSATGTGVILTETGYIVTNCHVVDGAVEISVLLTDDRTFPATLVGQDAASDLAVLHIDGEGLVPAQFGDDRQLQVGDSVAAIGDPLGIEFRGTLTDGIVSAINRDVTTGGRTMTLIQTNAALNSGNSGGPLINCYGQVIGINTLKIGTFTDASGVDGLGFAIPSSTVKTITEQLIRQGYVSGRPLLGISGETVSRFYQLYYRMPSGLYITQVTSGSPAYEAGIREGDIMLSVNGSQILYQEDLDSFLYGAQVGDEVEVVIYRGGKQHQATLTLAESRG